MKFSHAFPIALAAVLAPALAHADTFYINSVAGGSAPNPFSLTFSIPETPALGTYTVSLNTFSILVSSVRNGVVDSMDPITFYATASGGGLSDSDSSFFPYGPPLFSGAVNAPTFVPGTYALSNEYVGGPVDYYVTISNTPEPSSLALLGTGVVGLAGVARRRFKK